MNDRWEYQILNMPLIFKRTEQSSVAKLNELGDEGWEVIAAFGDPYKSAVVVMKRRVEPA